MCPLKLDFYTTPRPDDQLKGGATQAPTIYSVIYKHGDDVRQD